MHIRSVESTELFTGPAWAPRQVVRVVLAAGDRPPTGPVRVRVEGPTVRTPEPEPVPVLAPGEDRAVEVGVLVAAPHGEGSVHRVTAVAEPAAGPRATAGARITAAATGWTMWMVSHFHYDPVWWNTQGGFTELWHRLPDLPWVPEMRLPHVRTAFDLVRAHLEAARHDDDYRFVLAEADYLKPHWDAHPRDRALLRRLLREERVELVGGLYNEPNTNLTHPESTVRNAQHGIALQRDLLGGTPRTAWMVDVFGHDPSFPGLMADAGLDSSAWARGPFHMHGPHTHTGDVTRMQFPSEFEWISPSGRGVLTHYMAGHYTAGWALERTTSAEASMAAALEQFTRLKRVAATRNVLLPVGHDHNVPSRWCTVVHREWAKRYVWPRFTMGLPREFFAAVRRGLAERGAAPSPQTRDMNPVYTGKDVSYIDTKQAQRAGETAVLDAERLAALAGLAEAAPDGAGGSAEGAPDHPGGSAEGAPDHPGGRPATASYPAAELDQAWRQLLYGAHHDAITGTESDQVYLDLLAGWREAYELGAATRDAAVDRLAARTDTRGPGRPVLVANTLSWERDGLARVRVGYPEPGTPGVAVLDETGARVPAMAEGVRRHPDGSLAGVTLTFLARGLPSVGHRLHRLVPAADVPGGWTPCPGVRHAENAAFRVEAAPERGGALVRILDRRTGRELLRPGALGAELLIQDEHRDHPRWQEGPWHLLPTGPGRGTGALPAALRVEASPLGRRIVTTVSVDDAVLTQETCLWDPLPRIDFRTHLDGSLGAERLLRVRFGLDLPGALPVAEVGFAAVGRAFGFPREDAAQRLWALDSPAHTWAGLSAAARIRLRRPDGTTAEYAIGVAEVVAPEDAPNVRGLLARLAAQGVTATRTLPDGPRYGNLEVDSNLPDVRIAPGGAENPFARAVLAGADPEYRAALAAHGRVLVPAARPRRASWRPDADLTGLRDLPVLILAGDGTGAVTGSVIDVPDAGLPHADPPRADLPHADAPAAHGGARPRSVPAAPPHASGLPHASDSPHADARHADDRHAAGPSPAAQHAAPWDAAGPHAAPTDGRHPDHHAATPHADPPTTDDRHADHRDAAGVDAAEPYAGDAAALDARDAAGVDAEAPFPGHSVALLNRGTPGFVAESDGTLHLNLLRAHTGWPSGVWLDGERRTAPDGSSFSQQHWSHTFEYALVAGEGDWRDAGFVRAGQEFNHPPLVREASAHPGPLPPRVSLLTVEPADAVLSALTPHAADPERLTLRLYESAGRAATARIRLYGGQAAAARTDLLGERPRALATAGDGAVEVPLTPADVATVTARPAAAGRAAPRPPAADPGAAHPAARPGPGRPSGAPGEPVQPVFTRYWLHNDGPAPLGNLPVTVHVEPTVLALPADQVRVTVSCSTRPARGRLELVPSPGLFVVPPADLRYDLAPGEFAEFRLTARPVDRDAPGPHLLHARIRDHLGQLLEDTVLVGAETLPLGAELGPPDGLLLAPGERAELVLRLTGVPNVPLHGAARLLAPYGAWADGADLVTGPRIQPFTVPAGERAELRFPVHAPATARPGARTWALVKLTAHGRPYYTRALPLAVR